MELKSFFHSFSKENLTFTNHYAIQISRNSIQKLGRLQILGWVKSCFHIQFRKYLWNFRLLFSAIATPSFFHTMFSLSKIFCIIPKKQLDGFSLVNRWCVRDLDIFLWASFSNQLNFRHLQKEGKRLRKTRRNFCCLPEEWQQHPIIRTFVTLP